ncbi:ribonuclease 3-like [Dioscorea cayenensis subsp. rotundata]|uniref:Ribonuclease 3-like n=1 Tax=Dioscorea cayennensis subsp. rotundata TaxID=55577 RepID=A0AB40BAN7_DIOCR|nr:ribonuclease 3-like [Dioscorea cayenensis subsp. rotundata]
MAVRSKALILFPLFITILCLSFPATATSSSDVDFLYLTLTWPGTLCTSEKCCMPTTGEPALDFMVEDIKTYNNQTGEIVKNCKKTCQFYVNMMKDYINELYAHWSDLSCPSNNGLKNWKKTWCTYGQCSNLNQHDYIQTALNISYHVNLLEVLDVNRIVPSSSTRYKLQDIQNALRVNYGLSTHIECVNTWWPIWQPRKSLLSKINFCISKDGKSIISCPFNTETTCHDEVWFYPFTSNMLHPCTPDSAGLIKMPTEQYSAV